MYVLWFGICCIMYVYTSQEESKKLLFRVFCGSFFFVFSSLEVRSFIRLRDKKEGEEKSSTNWSHRRRRRASSSSLFITHSTLHRPYMRERKKKECCRRLSFSLRHFRRSLIGYIDLYIIKSALNMNAPLIAYECASNIIHVKSLIHYTVHTCNISYFGIINAYAGYAQYNS